MSVTWNKATVLLLTFLWATSIRAVDADSINRAASRDDFVHASLLVIGPGNAVYEAYGHVALRMECPSQGLDYCFTFEMPMNVQNLTKFFTSDSKAGFSSVPSEMFIAHFKKLGRSMTQYELNLLPKEKQTLWRLLDEEAVKPPRWTFDVTQNSCTSMVAYITEQSLDHERIVYHDLPQMLEGSYNDVADSCSRNSPWAGLFWKLHIGDKGRKRADVSVMFMPEVMAEVWQKATLEGDGTGKRPLVKGEALLIAPQVLKVEPPLVTPNTAGLILILTAVAGMVFFWRRKKEK